MSDGIYTIITDNLCTLCLIIAVIVVLITTLLICNQQRTKCTLTGIKRGGTANTVITARSIDNRQSARDVTVNIFGAIPSSGTSPSGEIFDNFPPRSERMSSSTPHSSLQYEKIDEQHSSSTKQTVRTCPGKKIPCGAVLSMNQNFCTQCQWKVDKSKFNTEENICKGIKEDGSTCNAVIPDDFRFCSMCGQKVLEDKSTCVYTCSGKTSDGGTCDFSSPSTFEVCPNCSNNTRPRGMRTKISCPGVKHPCGARLTNEDNYCPQCQWKVNKELFSSKSKCNALSDGWLCPGHIMEGDIFCSLCGNRVPEDPSIVRKCIQLKSDPPIPDRFRTRWKLPDVQIGDYLIEAMLTCRQVAILSFLMVIYEEYRAILTHISDGSLVFTFLHKDEESARRMMDDRVTVKKNIDKFLEKLDASVLYDHLDLTVDLVIDGEISEKNSNVRSPLDMSDISEQIATQPEPFTDVPPTGRKQNRQRGNVISKEQEEQLYSIRMSLDTRCTRCLHL